MELVTERLILREFQADDWPAVLAYQSSPRYLRYYAWTGRTEKEVRAFVQMFLDQQQAQPRIKYQLAVTLKSTDQLIGNCGIRLEAPNAREGDIGYELDPNHWGQGYATEAAQAIVRFGFTELGLHRIWSWCIADNIGSAHVLEKVGMRLEGLQRDKEHFKGRWWDTRLYAILEDEWRAQQTDRLGLGGRYDPAEEPYLSHPAMQCPNCNYDNPSGMKFCGACGTRLPLLCPACGFVNPAEFRFCGQCGTRLVPEPAPVAARSPAVEPVPSGEPVPPVAPAPPLAPTRAAEPVPTAEPAGAGLQGERRRVTVILADIKGSTALSERVDVETWVEIMNHVFQVLGAEIYRYGGEINQYRGDGLVAFFGLPTAHEDDPERAVLAALAMQDAIKRYAQELSEKQAIELLMRVGINTGEVIATSVGDSRQHSEETAMGRAVALAARMETASEPGTVLVTENTYRLVSAIFEWQALGEITVKGVSQPVSVYRPLAPRHAPSRGRGIAGMQSPLVGRDAEFRALHDAVERLQSGVGGIVTLVGEAGLGKSRLVTEIRDLVLSTDEGSRNLQWVEGRCLSYATTVAYQVWLNIFHSLLEIAPDTPASAVCDALERWIRSSSPDRFEDVFPFMARMLSLSLDQETQAQLHGLGAQGLQVSTFRAVETLVERTAAQRPLVLVCEDLHWSDPTSLELLERLLPLVDRTPLLLLCILRPELEHGCWRIVEIAARDYPHRHTDLQLRPLSSADGETLLKNLLLSQPGSGGQEPIEGLPQALKAQILSRGEGNPFYVEEILRALTHSGAIVCDEATCQWRVAKATDDILIPDTLYGVLRARIDQLPPGARRLLQIASVIGRIFSHRLLAHIVPQSELQEHLVTLLRAQMIRERAQLPEREYIFKHHLTQEAAYNSLLTRERRAYHRQVAETLEQIYSERMEERTGLLAHHWDRADEPQQAIPYLLRAGEQARIAYANQEAISHLQRALAQLDRTSTAKQPLRSLAETNAARLDALRGLGILYLVTAQIPKAEQHLREAIAVGKEIGLDVRERVRLYYWLGETLWWQSRYEDRIRVGEQGLALLGDDTESLEAALMNETIAVGYEESINWEKHHEIIYRTAEFLPHLPYSEELRPVYVHAWMVNLADKNLKQARAWLHELQAQATESHDLLALLEASFSQAVTQARVGDLHGTLLQVQQSLELSTRIGNLLHELRSRYLIGVVLLSLGELHEVEARATRTIQAIQGIPDASGMAFALQFAGRVSLCLGHTEAAIDAFEQAAALFRKTRLPFCEAQVTCQLGRAHLAQGDHQAAAHSFQAALSLASQGELGGYVHWSNYVLVMPNPTLADALSGLEEAEQDKEAFRAHCRPFRAQAGDGPFVQWALEPATPSDAGDTPLLQEEFAAALSPEWTWHDPFQDCTHALSDGLAIRAANGRDLLSVNMSAPRLLRPVSGDWAVQVQCAPLSGPALSGVEGQAPAIGGLVLWVNDKNYLRLDMGATGEHDLYFGGSLDNQDVLIGRGRLSHEHADQRTGSTFLRMERIGDRVAAFCSADGKNWFAVGSVAFPVEDPVQVGVHAIGKIDRAVYRGAFPDGTAIRFGSFQTWRL